jgi:hypothetical protein
MMTDTALVCPDLPGVDQLLDYYGIPYRRDEAAFTPVSAVTDHRHTRVASA